jgi:hypothetical protein
MKKIATLLLLFFTCVNFRVMGQPNASANPELLTQEWTAVWIGPSNVKESDVGVYHFRRSFEMAQLPSGFIIHVTADNRYRLFINGKAIGFGPARGDKLHWQYETYDLVPYLKTGRNTIAAQVWNLGDKGPVAQMSIGATALLVQGNGEKESVVNTTPENWRVTRDDAFTLIPVTGQTVFGYYAMGATDKISAAEFPWGWETNEFNDAGWPNPSMVRAAQPLYYAYKHGEADGGLTPRTIPMMEEKLERIPKVVRAKGIASDNGFLTGKKALVIPAHTQATILLDQTHLTTAYPELVTSGGKGSSIQVAYAEALLDVNMKKGNRDQTENKLLYGYYDVFVPDGGQNRLFRPLWYRTFRFIELTINTGPAPLTINDFYGQYTGYPFEEKASFSSDDPGLKKIWDVGWRTARLCANETYYDCPYYEQLQYVGDTRIQSLLSLHVAGDDRLMRNALTLYNQSRLPEGLTQSRYPTEVAQMIPPFSLYWVDMVHDYYMFRGDPAFIKQFLPGMQGTLTWFEDHLNEQHLLSQLGWWNFVDWTDAFERGVPMGAKEKTGTAIISLQFVYALDRAAEVFNSFGRRHESEYYSNLANTIREAVYRTCYDKGKQLFADTPDKQQFSQHANVMAILTDAAPADQHPALMKKVLSDKTLTQCSIYYRFYMMNALKKAGMADQYLENLDIWKDMLAEGLTTFPEETNDTRSDCHAWSSSPLIEFLATVCGIEPAGPGFKTVKIEPHLGPLQEVNGRMPHPLGDIQVALKRKGKNGVTATIFLPEGLTGKFLWNGESVNLKSGKQTVDK